MRVCVGVLRGPLLVHLGCQVKGRLREGEPFFFLLLLNKAILVSMETGGDNISRANDSRAGSGSRGVPQRGRLLPGTFVLRVRELKEPFR